MKNILLATLLLSGITFANDTAKVKRIQTMQNMETAMSTIQKGFMYNSREMIKSGIEKLKYNTTDLQAFEVANDKDKQFKAKDFAIAESKAIATLADQILVDFDNNKKEAVLGEYSKLQNQCVTCHMIVRRW